ncbi:MAG: bacterial transcriptional activator domain-containing protein [Acidimicrobiales bacterium]
MASGRLRRPSAPSARKLAMGVHAVAGNRAEALRTYQRCRTVLAEELGVPPSAETEAVYTAIVQA